MLGYDRVWVAVDTEVRVEVVPLTTVTVAEPDTAGLDCTGETEVALDSAGTDSAGTDAAGTDTVVEMAWLVVKTEVWVSVTGQMVVETAMTTVVTISLWLSVLAGQSVTVGAHEVIVWTEVE